VAEAGRIRIEVGFDGGQALSLLVEQGEAERLQKLLQESQAGATAFEADDGSYTVVLGKVTYLKRFTRESRVGFTGV